MNITRHSLLAHPAARKALVIIDRLYQNQPELKELLLHHSLQVARAALAVATRHSELSLNTDTLLEGALLHDVGIIFTDAAGIKCYGTAPYLLHGVIGAALLRAEHLDRSARIAARHTGTGLSNQQVADELQLYFNGCHRTDPTLCSLLQNEETLPERAFCPETEEEQVICYVDKYYSKSKPEREKTPEQVIVSLQKFGPTVVDTFTRWYEKYGWQPLSSQNLSES